jgi:hypothetical protein
MFAGSPVALSTTPVECSSHDTLDSTQFVSASKRSPSDAFAIDVVAHDTGFKKHFNKCISEP